MVSLRSVRADTGPGTGLGPLLERDAGVFFGRDAATHEVLALWLRCRLVVLHGSAGVGKSSLLRAGILPNLASVEANVLPVGYFDQPGESAGSTAPPADSGPDGTSPAAAHGSIDVANPFLVALLRSWSADEPSSPLLDVLRRVTESETGGGRGATIGTAGDHRRASRPILAAIDDFDDLFRADTPRLEANREQCIQVLAAVMAGLPQLNLLLVVRSDALGALARFERRITNGLPVTRVPVEPFDLPTAGMALAESLRARGRRLGPGVVEACVEDLRTSRVIDATGAESILVADRVQPVFLVLLAAAIRGLASADASRDVPVPADVEDGSVTLADLGSSGGVDAALGGYLTSALLAVAQAHNLDDAFVRTWLTRTFITERGRRGSVDEGIASTAGMPNAVLDDLTGRYVLASEQRSGARRFELFDDRLVPALQAAFPQCLRAGGSAPETDADDLLNAALLHFADGDLTAAGELAAEALRQGSADPGLGDPVVIQTGAVGTSEFAEAFRRVRTLARTVELRAQIDEAHEQLEAARGGYREAAGLYEALPDAEASGRTLAAVGRLLLQAGWYGRAIEDLQAASLRLPGDVNVQADLARALWYSGQPWAATAIYSTALGIAPGAVAALAGRGRLRAELGDDAAALEDLERLARLSPDLARTALLRAARALVLARLGRLEEAGREAAAALDAEPNSGEVLWRASGVERAHGRDSQADALLRRSLDAREPALLPHQQERVEQTLRRPGAMA
ncbi:tetratricopeptide repeat protein [Frankia sp. R82]|uniref:tetratricopeptide repeat protein n=1 Tax=Frankia sp. R82 TaxID=2950553 RepID=UPI0020437EEF|nr:tetratricopeptide repeat protein [Frankia sp. R82]MCM3882064.1 tetratricopeptide repeat protein [Frankia sp. R82]